MAKVPRNKKLRVFERDDWTCQYCGKVLDHYTATVDHIRPLANGGDARQIGNLATACAECNEDKGHKSLHTFVAAVGSARLGPTVRDRIDYSRITRYRARRGAGCATT